MNLFYRRITNILLLFFGMVCYVVSTHAATKENFLVRDTQDIVSLCSVSPEDALYTQAIHFCHGYLVGIYHYQNEFYSRPGLTPLVCMPEADSSSIDTKVKQVRLSRNQTIAEYIQWVSEYPDYLKEPVVDTVMKYLIDHFPCNDD